MKIVYANHQHDSLIKDLKKAGHEVIVPPCQGTDFQFDLDVLRNTVEFHNPDIVIGVCRGASLVMELNPAQPIILLAPDHQAKLKKPAIVIHGALDMECPAEPSMALENVILYMVQDDHWLKESGLKCLLARVAELSTLQSAVS